MKSFLSRGLALGVAAFCTIAFPASAAPVEWTSSEGYGSGSLNNQPSPTLAWKLVPNPTTGTPSFGVDATGEGKVNVDVARSTHYAIWQGASNFASEPRQSIAVDFQFNPNAQTGGTSPFVGLTYLSNATSGATTVRAYFGRNASTTHPFRFGFHQASGPQSGTSVPVTLANLGLSSGSGQTSKRLRLAFNLERGTSKTGWKATVILKNVTDNLTVAEIPNLTWESSDAFFADTSLYSAISSESVAAASLSSLQLLSFNSPSLAPEMAGMKLTFADEFNAESFDFNGNLKQWNDGLSARTINQEAQVYVPRMWETSANGIRLKAIKQDAINTLFENIQSPYHTQLAGHLTTNGRFSQAYGRFEMRGTLPVAKSGTLNIAKGIWPAFWLFAQNQHVSGVWKPELDIMEWVGSDPDSNHMTLHWHNKDGWRVAKGEHYTTTNFWATPHIYRLDWTPTSLKFYIDDVLRHELNSDAYNGTNPPTSTPFYAPIPSEPMYLMANLAVGSNQTFNGRQTGWTQWNTDTAFPASWEVDWIRVYQFENAPTAAPLDVIIAPATLLRPNGTPITKTNPALPGEAITLQTSFKTGNATFGPGNIGVEINSFDTSFSPTTYQTKYHYVSTAQGANQSVAYTIPITLGSLAKGMYSIKIGATVNAKSFSQSCAARLYVDDAPTALQSPSGQVS